MAPPPRQRWYPARQVRSLQAQHRPAGAAQGRSPCVGPHTDNQLRPPARPPRPPVSLAPTPGSRTPRRPPRKSTWSSCQGSCRIGRHEGQEAGARACVAGLRALDGRVGRWRMHQGEAGSRKGQGAGRITRRGSRKTWTAQRCRCSLARAAAAVRPGETTGKCATPQRTHALTHAHIHTQNTSTKPSPTLPKGLTACTSRPAGMCRNHTPDTYPHPRCTTRCRVLSEGGQQELRR